MDDISDAHNTGLTYLEVKLKNMKFITLFMKNTYLMNILKMGNLSSRLKINFFSSTSDAQQVCGVDDTKQPVNLKFCVCSFVL